ncbi:MAG: ABC transporter ATP-binding protein [Hydrogenoanaerobacterium sp.]
MKSSVLKRLLTFTAPYKKHLALALLSAVISVSLGLYSPIITGRIIDLIISKNSVDFSGILRLLPVLTAVILGSALFQWVMTLNTNIITHSAVKDIRSAVLLKIESAPLKIIDGTAHGDIISRMVNDTEQISDGLLQGFSQLFTGVITILGTLCFMLSVNAGITLVVVVLTPLSLVTASLIAKYSFNEFRQQAKIRGEIGGYIEEMLGGQRVVKAFGYEERAKTRFDEINARLYKTGVNAQFYSSLTNPTTRFLNGVVYACVGLAGALSVISGKLSVGQLSCFLTYANQYTKPFNEVSGVVTELQTAFASARRVFSVLDEPSEAPDPNDAFVMTKCEGDVSAHDVSFAYAHNRPLIEHLYLEVKRGQRIAIVGPTGCGKTTIINLLMRFYEIDSGKLTVDKIETDKITRGSLRRMYGMVLQESWIFTGTVRENIAYGKPEATIEEIISAAKAAYAHSFIKRLPHGYDTLIGEGGDGISSGQKQLLCIARILLLNPPMLILDEATSSIDTLTEIRIQKAFTQMMQGRTSFIVAHRLSTIREADCILVVRDGKIIEKGTHSQLLLQNGFYKELYNSQFAHNQ